MKQLLTVNMIVFASNYERKPPSSTTQGRSAANSSVSEMAGPDPIHPAARSFVQALHELGYREDREPREHRSAEGHV